MAQPARFDIILENGRWIGWTTDLVQVGDAYGGSRVEHVLLLKSYHRLPLLGTLLRHQWAKLRGAAFD